MSDTSIDQARKDLLTQLAAMGVVLPRGTKMTNDALEKRLSQALDASQTLHEVIPSTPFNPDSFPPWDMSKSLLKAVHRGNVMEAVMNAATSSRTELGGGQSVPPSQENIFMEVRQCMLQFAKHFEDRHSTFVLQDKAQESGLIIRIDQVYTVNEDCPVFVIYYKPINKTPRSTLQQMLHTVLQTPGAAGCVWTSPLERAMLLKLLELNSKRISSDYQPTTVERESKSFRLSFLLPIGPLSMKDLGKLTQNDGCAYCGDANSPSRCAGCQVVRYCSQACQREDWKSHKASCRIIKGGRWCKFRFQLSQNQFNINRFDRVSSLKGREIIRGPGDSEPPPNIHSDKPFLVKLQQSLDSDSMAPELPCSRTVYIYDRQRSFEAHLIASEEPDAYREASATMKATGYMGMKMYRWAQRVGDFELSVCFDRAPEKMPAW